MQKPTQNKIKLGAFVSISIAFLIVGIYLIGKKQQLFNNTFHVSGIFKDINGLQVGNNVRFAGINVGIIEGIQQITDSTVLVDMSIDQETKKFMKKSSKALISSDGMMGNKIVIIIPGKNSTTGISDNDLIETLQPVNMDDVLQKIKITGDNAALITGDLAVIMDNIRQGKGTIGKLFMDTVFAGNLDKTLLNIRQGAGGFKQNMDAASHNILLKGFLKKKNKDKERDKEKEKETEKKCD